MGKRLIACVLSIICLLTPTKTIKSNQYSIYIPEEPDSIIIYYNCNSVLPHSKTENPKRPFNFQEGIANKMFANNPNSITVVTYQYSKKLVNKIDELIEEYNLTDIIISGWSAGGNNAIQATAKLANNERNIYLLLIDCNDTNQLPMKYFNTLAKYNIPIHYTSNVMGYNKNKVLKNIMAAKLDITFYKLKIPKNYSGSHHIYCRNCAVNYDLYGYLLGAHELGEHYKLGYYDYKKHKSIF